MADNRTVHQHPVATAELPVAKPQGLAITAKGQIAAVASVVRDAGKWFRLRFNPERDVTIGNRTYGVPALEGWNTPQNGPGFWGMMQKDLTEEGVVFATCAVWPNGMVAVFQDAEALAAAKAAIADNSPLAKGQDAYMAAIRAQLGVSSPARPVAPAQPAPRGVQGGVAEELDFPDEPPF